MGKLVFKQWLYQPNKKSTPRTVAGMLNYIATRDGVELGNRSLESELSVLPDTLEAKELYIQYIATRPGAIKAEDKTHGLFGRLQSMNEMGDIVQLEQTRIYVENLARNKTTIYNAVISLKEDDAIKKDLINRSSWEDFINAHINDIAREMGIPPRTLEWVGAVHIESGHPHLHLMYWDTAQKIGVNYIDPQLSNNIRRKITKDLFGEEIKEQLQEKDKFRAELIEKISKGKTSILETANVTFRELRQRDIRRILSRPSPYKLLNRRIADVQCRVLIQQILELRQALIQEYPSGALKFQYLPDNLKVKFNQVTKNILQNPQIAQSMACYLDAVGNMAQIYGGKKNTNVAIEKARRDLTIEIGNKLLSAIKEINKIQQIANTAPPSRINDWLWSSTVSLLQDILNIINLQESKLQNPKPYMEHTTFKNLTQAQKRDLFKQMMDEIEGGDSY